MGNHGDGSIYSSGGRWRASIMVDGKRKYLSARTRAEVLSKLREARGSRDRGELALGRSPRLGVWLAYWLKEIAPGRCQESTLVTYETLIRNQITPRIGHLTLSKLQPDHLRELYAAILASGRSPSTARQCHAILRRSLKVAVHEQKAIRNVAELIDGPSVPASDIEPFSRAQARTLVAAATQMQDGIRWIIALALGMRQGEVLAVEWPNIVLPPLPDPGDPDFDPAAPLPTGTLAITHQLKRRATRHGCGPKVRQLVKVRGSKEKVLAEVWPCGKKQAARCPARPHDGGLYLKLPKSRASRRTIALPLPVTEALRMYRDDQAGRRATAAAWVGWSTLPEGERRPRRIDLVFCQADGKPIDSRRDYQAWQDFLAAQGIPPARLHDARHTAATVLLALGAQVRAVAGMLGHARPSMTAAVYQHWTPEVAEGVAGDMDRALWGEDEVAAKRKARKAPARAKKREAR